MNPRWDALLEMMTPEQRAYWREKIEEMERRKAQQEDKQAWDVSRQYRKRA